MCMCVEKGWYGNIYSLYDLSAFELYFENMAIYFFFYYSFFCIMLEKSIFLACGFIFFFFIAHVSFEGKSREKDS
jgi:hypothetical protein